MGSTSARRKLAEELNAKEDRISNLPSCLMSHILSFLPTRNAVATSVLSTKWKDLWTLTPSLELVDYDSMFQIPQEDRLKTSFTKFMYQVLLHDRFPCLRKFRLQCVRDYGEYHVYAWVDFALKHNVQELDISLPRRSSPMLPRSLFTCRTLVKLGLGTSSVMMAHTEVVLPCLKVLHLSSFTLSIILDIRVRRCEFKAPLSHLRRACIEFEDSHAAAMYSDIHRRAVNDLLERISRVEFLRLGPMGSIEAILRFNYRLPTFQNLKTLDCKFVGPSLLLELPRSSPLLRTLDCGPFGEGENWNPPEDVPKCLLFHLKFIDIKIFRGDQEDVEVVEYFLKNASAVEKLIVQTGARISTTKMMEINTKLLMLPRASADCQFQLLSFF